MFFTKVLSHKRIFEVVQKACLL